MTVQYGIKSGRLPTPADLRRWTRAVLRRKANITLRIVGGREARRLNRRFRGRDYATNVLSFAYRSRPLEGDIAICAPVVAREARERGVASDAHYAHLTIHGVLHLLGHDHQRARQSQAMEHLEARILAGLGYADPYRSDAAHPGTATKKTPRRRNARALPAT